MTLTRGPCELDNMSLFQDLKLKRRKVDSRCSSDGESVADTSTSSPDLLPLSPRMAGEGRASPEPVPPPLAPTSVIRTLASCSVIKTEGSKRPDYFRDKPDDFFKDDRSEADERRKTDYEKQNNDYYLEKEKQKQEFAQEKQRNDFLKEERQKAEFEKQKNDYAQEQRQRNDYNMKEERQKAEYEKQKNEYAQRNDYTMKDDRKADMYPKDVLMKDIPQGVLVKRENYNNNMNNISTSQLQQNPVCSRLSPAPRPRAPIQQNQILPPISPQQHHLWVQASRINGVKPELIGGNFPPSGMMHEQRGPRTTPTVIMGESGGVRTMFWSPAAPPQSPVQSETSSAASGPSRSPRPPPPQVPDESAAHLLLGLGGAPHGPLNMERLWAGDLSQLPPAQQLHALNLSAASAAAAGSQLGVLGPPLKALVYAAPEPQAPPDEDDQPMICMICEDKATGLHYGIITCEGCKGFFKRTVQNRRVYTCVADGNCEITKAQRNRCQYCRFKKCIEQGMVLQAVREDRMPGGRNSGAVYNLYKVKYKKHKKSGQKGAQSHGGPGVSPTMVGIPPRPEPLANGTILKTALTNPSEIVHLRQRLDSAVSSSSSREREWDRDRSLPAERAAQMIQALIDCDAMEDIATVQHLPDLLEDKSEIGDKLCKIGDSIVHKMVAWTKKLPFILEIPMKIHSKLLMDKWHEISVLTTAAYQAMHGKNAAPHHMQHQDQEAELAQEVNANLRTLQTCLTTLMGRPITMEQLRLDVGLVVERMTQITIMFRRIKLRMEEYVCLKVYILLNNEEELEGIQERYVQALRSFLQHTAPHHPARLNDLFARIPEIQAAAALLLESKMFYVPFVLNSAEVR